MIYNSNFAVIANVEEKPTNMFDFHYFSLMPEIIAFVC